MTKSRREQLEVLLAAKPQDAFLRYGIAMEHAREGRPDEAVAWLEKLIVDQPDYVPAYFQSGQILIRQGDNQRATDLLRRGILQARAQSNPHAAEEMSALLNQIE